VREKVILLVFNLKIERLLLQNSRWIILQILTAVVNLFTLKLMPTLVHNSQFTIHGFKKTDNRQLTTDNKHRRRAGLTMVELLIVIAIVGILAAIVSPMYLNHQKQARDAQRKSDLQTVKKALEQSKNDCANAAYYLTAAAVANNPVGTGARNSYGNIMNNLTGTATKYLQNYINDPQYNSSNANSPSYEWAKTINLAAGKCVNFLSGLNTYAGTENWVIRAKLENKNDPESAKSYVNCSATITLIGSLTQWSSTPSSGDNFYYICSE